MDDVHLTRPAVLADGLPLPDPPLVVITIPFEARPRVTIRAKSAEDEARVRCYVRQNFWLARLVSEALELQDAAA